MDVHHLHAQSSPSLPLPPAQARDHASRITSRPSGSDLEIHGRRLLCFALVKERGNLRCLPHPESFTLVAPVSASVEACEEIFKYGGRLKNILFVRYDLVDNVTTERFAMGKWEGDAAVHDVM
jgi:hypothetical protein